MLHSDYMEIEGSALSLLLDSGGMNSLLYSDGFGKICFTSSVVWGFLGGRGRTVYLDLDTVFTSYLRNGIVELGADRRSGELEIFLPAEDEFESMLADVCSSLDARGGDGEKEEGAGGLVVVDSLNSFYHLYEGIKIGSLNHLLSVYISLLLNHTRRAGSTLLVTSMMRYKKHGEWILAPSSRRLIKAKSSVLLGAELVESNLVISLLKHRPLRLQSAKKLVIPKSGIPIRA